MNMNEYQTAALRSKTYPAQFKIIYPALKLAGEAGEVADKVGKLLRGDHGPVDMPLDTENQQEQVAATGIVGEIGDCLWYCAALAADLGWDLEEIARVNLDKTHRRMLEGTVKGSGDDR